MTYQRPAYEEVRIAHGGSTVTLRPTLRAAITLEARFGFPAMFRALEEGNLTIISEIILAASSSRQDRAAFLFGIEGKSLTSFIGPARMPLAELVCMLRPAPSAHPDMNPASPSAKSVMWADFYAHQFEQATGWLGWTPEQAWNATPTEIDRAFTAHFEKLKAIHGSGEDDKKSPAKAADPEQAARNVAAGLDADFDRSGLQALKMKIASGS